MHAPYSAGVGSSSVHFIASARRLDAEELTDIGGRALAVRPYWAVGVASVPAAERRVSGVLSFPAGASAGELDATLSFAGADTMTVRVVVDVRPDWPTEY